MAPNTSSKPAKIITSNPGYGYHGAVYNRLRQVDDHHPTVSDKAHGAYNRMHAKVKKVATEAGHLAAAKKPNVMVRDFLDSQHGRHLDGFENDTKHISRTFGHFAKSYDPTLFESTSGPARPRIETKKYSWGKMVTLHHGAHWTIPLHPEHQEAIAKLKDGEHTNIKDETGRKLKVHREGDDVHFHELGAYGAHQRHMATVKHSALNEESIVKTVVDKLMTEDFTDWGCHRVVVSKGDHAGRRGVIVPPEGTTKPKDTYRVRFDDGHHSYVHKAVLVKEDVEQIDELSKKTLGSYADKGLRSAQAMRYHSDNMSDHGYENNDGDKSNHNDQYASHDDNMEKADRLLMKSRRRMASVGKAIHKLGEEVIGEAKERVMDRKFREKAETALQKRGFTKPHKDGSVWHKPTENGRHLVQVKNSVMTMTHSGGPHPHGKKLSTCSLKQDPEEHLSAYLGERS